MSTYFVGRNQAGVNMSFTALVNVPVNRVGNLFQVQLASQSDTFTSVTNIGSLFQVTHSSEAQGL